MVDKAILAAKTAAIRDAVTRIRAVLPATYRELFEGLADHGVLDVKLAERLAAAAGLRNLVAHQYGVLDPARVRRRRGGSRRPARLRGPAVGAGKLTPAVVA